MKRLIRLTALLLCLLLLWGCAPEEQAPTVGPTQPPETEAFETQPRPTQPEGTPDTDGIIDIGIDKLNVDEEVLYQQFFDKNNRIDLDLQMSGSELRKMQQDYDRNSKSPIYRMADLLVTLTTAEGSTTYRIAEVGVRMKGNTSRTSFYDDLEGIYNYIHLRLNFQETFDDREHYGDEARDWASKEERKARKNRTFATLEKLELRWNKVGDSTYLREGYAYDLYREQGVLAPRTNLASLDWSGQHMGVYSVNEPVDEEFLRKNLPAKDLGGDLYKLSGTRFTGFDSVGVEDELKGEFYAYDLKTNKKTSQHEALKALINGLNYGSVTKESFAQLVDVDYFLRYAAVAYFLGNPDDLRNNYANSYIYFLKSSGKAIIIPYDNDRCLGITHEWDPTGNGLTQDNPFTDKTGGSNFSRDQENPLFIFTVDAGGYYVREFAQVLEQVAASELLKPETFEALFNTAKGIYCSDVTPSKDLRNDGNRDHGFSLDNREYGNMSFETYIARKLQTYRSYAARVEEFAEVDVPVFHTFYIRGDFNDWSNHEEYAMTQEGGLWVYYLNKSHAMSLKVYNNLENRWYGTEAMDDSTTVEYTTNDHGNIQLPAGSYRIAFDPAAETVTVTKA